MKELLEARAHVEQFRNMPAEQTAQGAQTAASSGPMTVQTYQVSFELKAAAHFTADQGAGS
jgi:hypothetical protein